MSPRSRLLADCCPFCHPGDHPAVLPLAVAGDGPGSLRAAYRHDPCGRQWSTWWDREAAGWPEQGREPFPAGLAFAASVAAAKAAITSRVTGPQPALRDDADMEAGR